jgi:hypothetical protein
VLGSAQQQYPNIYKECVSAGPRDGSQGPLRRVSSRMAKMEHALPELFFLIIIVILFRLNVHSQYQTQKTSSH